MFIKPKNLSSKKKEKNIVQKKMKVVLIFFFNRRGWPIDNIPSTDLLHLFLKKKNNNLTHSMWHVTHDMWHMTYYTWKVVGGEHSLKTSGP